MGLVLVCSRSEVEMVGVKAGSTVKGWRGFCLTGNYKNGWGVGLVV